MQHTQSKHTSFFRARVLSNMVGEILPQYQYLHPVEALGRRVLVEANPNFPRGDFVMAIIIIVGLLLLLIFFH